MKYPEALLRSLFVLCLLLGASISARAQGCSMCYNNAAQANEHQRAALRRGILVLGIPAGLMICGLALAAYRSNNNADDER
ncbi:MAG: hypothetical protein ABI383_09675 [Acidobacteriaceae bacterium]